MYRPSLASISRRFKHRAVYCVVLTLAVIATIIIGPSNSANALACKGADLLPRLTTSHPEVLTTVRREAARIPNTQAIFWRVEKSGSTPSHLFGTMHVSDERIVQLPAAAAQALDKAKLVALEIAGISPAATLQAVAEMPELMAYSDGTKLSQKLTATEFAKIESLLGSSGLPKQMVTAMRPWLASVFISVPLCEQRRTFSGKPTLDSSIESRAQQRKTPVVGLETISSQLRSMASIPDADQLNLLRVSLAFIDQREDLFETLIQSYLKRDLGLTLALTQGMARIAGFEKSGFAAFSRVLIEERNQTMFDSSLPLVDQGNAFIAVGAAHLIGETGLVALYRKAGFTVTALN